MLENSAFLSVCYPVYDSVLYKSDLNKTRAKEKISLVTRYAFFELAKLETQIKNLNAIDDTQEMVQAERNHGIKKTNPLYCEKYLAKTDSASQLDLQGKNYRPLSFANFSWNMSRSGTSRYEVGRILGNGSFGLVCEARRCDTGELVAIKKVLQDPEYKNRELSVMKELNHPNIVTLKDYFYTECTVPVEASNEEKKDTNTVTHKTGFKTQRYLNVVMEYVPDTVYRVMKTYLRNFTPLPLILVRLYTFQLCRSLGYLHGLGFCHRDIKPHNLLVNTKNHVLKLCDFGSAKRLHPAEPSVAYICSRFYRAPELMLGATEYTTAIDIWSVGCVLGEFLIGKPIFPGDSSVDQLVKIIQVLGTPTPQQMQAMNPNYSEFQFPNVRSRDWTTVLLSLSPTHSKNICSEATHLLSCFLKYDPRERLKPYDALTHPFFDPLYDSSSRLPDGSCLPELFNFTESELVHLSNELKSRALSRSAMTPNQTHVLAHQNSKENNGIGHQNPMKYSSKNKMTQRNGYRKAFNSNENVACL